MIRLLTSSVEDDILLTSACALKQLSYHKMTPKPEDPATMEWDGGRASGLAAILLVLESAAPTPSLFPNGNVGMPLALLHWRAKMIQTTADTPDSIHANAALVSRQMNDGRTFLQGNAAGLADLCAASWLIPRRSSLACDPALDGWLDRMTKLGQKPSAHNTGKFAPAAALTTLQKEGLLVLSHADGTRVVTSPLDL